MITLFVIGIMIFTFKLIRFACKAAWSITRVILFGVGIPVFLTALFAAGLVYLAVPLLVIGLLSAFLRPMFN